MTEPNPRQPRRKFTAEFRADAVRVATSSQTTIAQTARDLGFGDTLLRVWIAAAKTPETSLTMSERTELDSTANRVNDRPRKTLGFQKPAARQAELLCCIGEFAVGASR